MHVSALQSAVRSKTPATIDRHLKRSGALSATLLGREYAFAAVGHATGIEKRVRTARSDAVEPSVGPNEANAGTSRASGWHESTAWVPGLPSWLKKYVVVGAYILFHGYGGGSANLQAEVDSTSVDSTWRLLAHRLNI